MKHFLLNYKFILLIVFICIVRNSYCQCKYTAQTVNSNNGYIYAKFTSPSTGYSLYEKDLCSGRYSEQCPYTCFLEKTMDSGKTWTTVYTGLGPKQLYSLNDSIIYNRSETILCVSKTGGKSWDTLTTNYFYEGDYIFTDTSTGFVAAGNIYRSDNGGRTWDTVYTGSYVSAIAFVNADAGFALAQNANPSTGAVTPIFLKTTDKGKTWIPESIQPPQLLTAIHFADANHGYICGAKGLLMITQDAGKTWNYSYISGADSLTNVYFYDANHGIVTDQYSYSNIKYFITKDGGTTWNIITTPIGAIFNYPQFNHFLLSYRTADNIYATNDSLYQISRIEEAPAVTSIIPTTSVSELKIYPNPSGGLFNLQFPEEGTYNITLVNALGSEIKSYLTTSTNKEILLDMRGVPPGIFYVNVSGNSSILSTKLIVQ